MLRKNLTCLIALSSLLVCQSVFGFTLINQTDKKIVVKLQEAVRPKGKDEKIQGSPRPLSSKSHKVTLLAKSTKEIEGLKPCSVLLVSVVESKTKRNKTNTMTVTTCYEPYDYEGETADKITDSWGLLFHKPLPEPVRPDPFSPEYQNYHSDLFFWRDTVENGYGIKCLHPLLLEKVRQTSEPTAELFYIN